MDAAVKAVFAALIWHTPELLPLLVSLFLYYRVKEHNKGLQVGRKSVDAAVKAVFAALIWHTHELLPLLLLLFTIL